jgi:riboflavin synthase
MFTGIVAGTGRVVEVSTVPGAAVRLVVDVAATGRRPRPGDSVSVAGVCLTVVSLRGRRAAFDVIGETVRRTTLGALGQGDLLNLEGALRAGDEIGGHQVSGHVDGVGTVRSVDRRRDETWVTIAAPRGVHDSLVEKGWVAVDGVSLTVAAVGRGTFSVALIPTTLEVTTLSRLVKGSRVNLEGDPLGKHVARWMAARARTRRTGTRRR